MPRPLLALLLGAGCQPMLAGPVPLPLAADTVSTVEISAASPRAPALREAAPLALQDPPLPRIQLHAASTFALTDRVEAGPTFLLDIGDRGAPGVVTGGLFVRVWTGSSEQAGRVGTVEDPATDAPTEVAVALRVEAGWAWLGLGADVVLPVSDDTVVTLSPTVQGTPDLLLGRLPVGAWLRTRPVDVGVEGGLTAGGSLVGPPTPSLVPWVGLRLRLSL